MALTIDPQIYCVDIKPEIMFLGTIETAFGSIPFSRIDTTDFYMNLNGQRFLNLTVFGGTVHILSWSTDLPTYDLHKFFTKLYQNITQDLSMKDDTNIKHFSNQCIYYDVKDGYSNLFTLEDYLTNHKEIQPSVNKNFSNGNGSLKICTPYFDCDLDQLPKVGRRINIMSSNDLSNHLAPFIRSTSIHPVNEEDEQQLQIMVSYLLDQKIFHYPKN